MKIDDKKIKEILLKGGYADPQDIKKAEEFSKKHRGSIVDYFLAEKLLTNDLLGQAIAESFTVSYSDLNSHQPSSEQVLKIPEEIAEKYRAVVFAEDKNDVIIATDNPEQEGMSAELKKIFKTKKIKITYSLPEDIDVAFIHYRKKLETRFAQIIEKQGRVAPEIIEEIFADALTFRASDIHFEPQEKEVVIRFRIDGVLHEAGRIPKEHYENILNRIKVQAHLRIDEHFAAQDGAIRHASGGGIKQATQEHASTKSIPPPKDNVTTDMRVSIAPTLDGEKITIRMLSSYVRSFTLTDLGLSAYNQKLLSDASKKPFGMILVTGPTGSGKTTSLYALLKILNRPEVNITTIEDPVEYKIVGVNQIQVNQQTNLTFSQGLRSIVRQDPNIILVGEIRDEETAEIAVNAALTGHLLLSTFHANDAATSIPRLLNMKIEPFLLASTLEVIIAQRLVRTICESCRYSMPVKQEEIAKLLPDAKKYFSQKTTTLYKGKGCKNCGDSGFKGRTAIFEFIAITAQMQELILKNPSTQQIWELARKQGAISLFEDGVEKVKKGATTLEELLRVAQPPA